jgi:hypothetical protein
MLTWRLESKWLRYVHLKFKTNRSAVSIAIANSVILSLYNCLLLSSLGVRRILAYTIPAGIGAASTTADLLF